MANHCENRVTVTLPAGADWEMVEYYNKFVEAVRQGNWAEYVVPVHPDLDADGANQYGGPRAAEFDAIRAANKAKHGYESSYEFRNAKWGTKWIDSYRCQVGKRSVSIAFESAWAPPLPIYWELHLRGLNLRASWVEEGMYVRGKLSVTKKKGWVLED